MTTQDFLHIQYIEIWISTYLNCSKNSENFGLTIFESHDIQLYMKLPKIVQNTNVKILYNTYSNIFYKIKPKTKVEERNKNGIYRMECSTATDAMPTTKNYNVDKVTKRQQTITYNTEMHT